MRKDLFIVGARLLGAWQLLGAAGALGYVLVSSMGLMPMPPASQAYYGVRGVVLLAAGLYLIYRPYHLFHLLDNLGGEKDDGEAAEESIPQQ